MRLKRFELQPSGPDVGSDGSDRGCFLVHGPNRALLCGLCKLARRDPDAVDCIYRTTSAVWIVYQHE